MKAMILAAGRGTRLGALTDSVPKPLMEVMGKPLIVHQIEKLKASGMDDIVINVSYLGHVIQKALGDGSDWGVRLYYSVEDPVLETGGGILKALPHLGSEPFVVVSADIWTEFDYESLSLRKNSLAHMILVENPEYLAGDFSLDEDGFLTQEKMNPYTYANIGLYHPKLFAGFSVHPFPLMDVWHPALEKKQITAAVHPGFWTDLGAPERLRALQARLTQSKD